MLPVMITSNGTTTVRPTITTENTRPTTVVGSRPMESSREFFITVFQSVSYWTITGNRKIEPNAYTQDTSTSRDLTTTSAPKESWLARRKSRKSATPNTVHTTPTRRL